ncbi:GTP 3',8-cyclase MoaA [Allorhizobium borbori]|uniref:GTP 3',8-cyclase n=1 Tax=Allorhizobium borbori TaxID=485907 RepID=A0A7W6K2C6_9HYPH|nr:GTP 3',8-cyclase MoaA [Allorhizobium borbori]MBB4102991.1 cyclic pyranopterin phosphate synthase [Allorhizobium borbori]
MRHEQHIATGTEAPQSPLVDRFGRQVTYLRLSVTDRCDLRCTYCMAEHMTFLPRQDVLSLEELYRLARVFIRGGVRKIRLTGGEPLVRKNILQLFSLLAPHLDGGELDEVTLTTNGTLLSRYAEALFATGVRRVNVSLDSLDAGRYARITRWGRLDSVLKGIDAALSAGLKVKLNAVAMRGDFESEVDDLIGFAHGRGMDLTLIEEMPLGQTGHDRSQSFLPLDHLRRSIGGRWTLVPIDDRTGGPARYVRVAETGGRLGFITPLSCDFCASCNRVRVSCTGDLFTCMGSEGMVGLRQALRGEDPEATIGGLIRDALGRKPKGHSFEISRQAVSGIARHMSVLGG